MRGFHAFVQMLVFMMVVGAQQGMWDMLDAAVRKLQELNMAMRYSPKPVVVAPAGLALGGGAICPGEMRARDDDGGGAADEGLVDVGFVQRGVGGLDRATRPSRRRTTTSTPSSGWR